MADSLAKKFGNRVKEIRKSKGLTQAQFAEMVGIEDISLSRIETGLRLPQKGNLEKIANAFGVEIKDLFDFRYQKTVAELKKEIEEKIKNAKRKDLQYYNKMIDAYLESR